MKSNDILEREEIRAQMQKAINENDTEGFYNSFDQMLTAIEQSVKDEYARTSAELRKDIDQKVLASRGIRQLTGEEKTYYQKLAGAMCASNPKQALLDADLVLPQTVIDRVFDEVQTAHPLLSAINFVPSGGAITLMVNTNGYQTAAWGSLCAEIVEELTSGFKEIDATLLKLSAFMPVCKAMLDLGPEWLDDYVRQVLYEAISNGLEAGIVVGDGNGKPIGMNRQVGDNVVVTGGVYPEKAKIAVNDLSPATIGNLISLLAVDPNGKPRRVENLLLIVNSQDYFQKVMPATTLLAPDGSYRNDVLPFPMRVIPSPALAAGDAILGIGYRYFAAAGTSPDGRIEYSDHYRFLEDERVYIIKAYVNGMPLDDNAFLYLDISGLAPAVWRVELATAATPSDNAALANLRIGNLTLSPVFAAETTTYTAATTAATNTITAVPADAGSTIEILVGDNEISNGTAATWAAGANTVTITVTAEDGTTTETYTVTVTKS